MAWHSLYQFTNLLKSAQYDCIYAVKTNGDFIDYGHLDIDWCIWAVNNHFNVFESRGQCLDILSLEVSREVKMISIDFVG